MYANRSDTGHKKKVSLIIKADDWRYPILILFIQIL